MNKKDIHNKVLASKKSIINHGQLNEKILLALKMTTSLYEYIEVITEFYDDNERPDFNNWVDVEGMGYGWAWMNYENEEHRWHEMMSKMVSHESEGLLSTLDDTYFIIYENERGKVFHFITLLDSRFDTIITFSHSELNY